MVKKASLLWMDLEMTGLDASRDKILEVACIATDWEFAEIATFEAAVRVPNEIVKERMVGDFWKKFARTRKSLVKQNNEAEFSSAEVEQKLLEFIDENFDAKKEIYLAGNSIHQDRKFIVAEWPLVDAKLHYRMLDVSAWKIVFVNKM
ncbi:MAG: oligoribonuclease, partial [Candidatus Nomurabacteria bacterium]|nr:oligoribonuclease [Candidatus Nomurabacteria bacterium]